MQAMGLSVREPLIQSDQDHWQDQYKASCDASRDDQPLATHYIRKLWGRQLCKKLKKSQTQIVRMRLIQYNMVVDAKRMTPSSQEFTRCIHWSKSIFEIYVAVYIIHKMNGNNICDMNLFLEEQHAFRLKAWRAE